MIIEFLRKKILQKQFFARQFWEPNDNKHKSNIFNELNLENIKDLEIKTRKFFFI